VSAPKDVLAQLLSPQQAETLDGAGQAAWAAAASALAMVLTATPGLSNVDGRLVMPDEITGDYEEPHLVLPLEITTDRDQTANAYAIARTADAAAFFDSTSDDPTDEEQQTIVLASTILSQVAQGLNSRVFAGSPVGLVIAFDDIVANTMPALLTAMDEPALALTATLSAGRDLPFSLVLPGTFLDIVAGALPVAVAAAQGAPGSAIDPSLGFSLTADELDDAEILDEPPARPVAPSAPAPQPVRPAAAAAPSREPTPISSAPAAQRARFAPLPDPQPSISQSGIEMLAGLRMNICVELGRTDLTVSEVLALGSGSVIELDRLAGEPVDILVNDRLIARGEVVVVDENFGVRVVEVVRRGGETEERTG
jgi:flagellar motor switch protein FliN/FliY